MASISINQNFNPNQSWLQSWSIKTSIPINHDSRSNQSLSNPDHSLPKSRSIMTPDPINHYQILIIHYLNHDQSRLRIRINHCFNPNQSRQQIWTNQSFNHDQSWLQIQSIIIKSESIMATIPFNQDIKSKLILVSDPINHYQIRINHGFNPDQSRQQIRSIKTPDPNQSWLQAGSI